MKFEPQDKARYERLQGLAPLAAVQAWLDGDFGIGDEPVLLTALRRDPWITASADALMDTLCDAMDEQQDAATCLERLATP